MEAVGASVSLSFSAQYKVCGLVGDILPSPIHNPTSLCCLSGQEILPCPGRDHKESQENQREEQCVGQSGMVVLRGPGPLQPFQVDVQVS